MVLNRKLKFVFNYCIGPILLIWLLYSIHHQIQRQQDLGKAWQNIARSFAGPDRWIFLVVVLLMFVNWGIEAKKWQLLIRDIQQISFVKAFMAIFSGQAFAFNTINNVGECFGKIMYLEEGNRLRAIGVTIIGNVSQLITTLAMGIVGLLYIKVAVLKNTEYMVGLSAFWLNGLIYVVSFGTLVLLLIYYCTSWITRIVEKIPIISKYTYLIQKMEGFHWKELTLILFLSLTRFAVFVFQYLLLLHIFKVDADFIQMGWMICVMFLVFAVMPSIAMAELGIRGEVGKWIRG